MSELNKRQIWKLEREKIKENMNLYVSENKSGMYLKDIAEKHSISIAQLKKVFKETNTPIILHSHNEGSFFPHDGLEEFTKRVQTEGKKKTSVFYNTTLNVIAHFCRNRNIEVEKFKGMMNRPDSFDVDNFLQDLDENILNRQEIQKKHGITNSIMIELAKKHNKQLPKSLIAKQIEKKNGIKGNIQYFIEENHDKGISLQQLANDNNISIETLRNIFVEKKIQNKTKNRFFPYDGLEEFIKRVQIGGKKKTAYFYNVPFHTIQIFCRKFDIEIEQYKGLIKRPKDFNLEEFLNDLSILSRKEIIEKHKITSTMMVYLANKHNVKLPKTQFDLWKEERNNYFYFIEKNIDEILNKQRSNYDLKMLSKEYNLPKWVLPQYFKDNNIPVSIHSYNKSKGELEVLDYVKSLGFPEAHSIKRKFNDKWLEMDIFVESKNFAIEYCGEYWHSTEILKENKYHFNKFKWCKEQGISLFTIFEHEWKQKSEVIKSMIRHRLGKTLYTHYARNLTCKEINSVFAKHFHDRNHFNGGVSGTINYGLFDKNENLISVLTIGKSRFSKQENVFEIIRFSSLLNNRVIGGFNKLLDHVIRNNPHINHLETYADLRFGEGNVYTSGKYKFNFVKYTYPNYYYFNPDDINAKFESRQKYQRHKLGVDDYSLSESQIMNELGFFRIYDCGNAKYQLLI